MTISFVTPTTIDLAAALTFGMSVKEKSDAIGYFGTGLKYAVATLLRTGHKISVTTGGNRQTFRLVEKEHRGRTFGIVCLEETPLGFTTELGKNWELWMAFRELHSNTLDENGDTRQGAVEFVPEGHTVIEIDGVGIDNAFLYRQDTFCEGSVLDQTARLKVRSGQNKHLYYRGVRAMNLDKPSMFTYDILARQTLTEDRTFSSPWSVMHDVVHAIASMNDIEFLRTCLQAQPGTFESKLDYEGATPSAAFLQVVKECHRSEFLNDSARKLGRKHNVGSAEEILTLNAIQQKQLERATEFLTKIGFDVTRFPIKVCELHGPLAMAKDGTIFLTPQLFRMGTKYLALGVFEEFIHMSEGVHDETREMQTCLFEIIMSMGEQLVGEPL